MQSQVHGRRPIKETLITEKRLRLAYEVGGRGTCLAPAQGTKTPHAPFVHVNHFTLYDSATLRTVAHQVPLSMGCSRQEYWSGLPFPSPGDLPNPRIQPVSLLSPALTGGFFGTSAT